MLVKNMSFELSLKCSVPLSNFERRMDAHIDQYRYAKKQCSNVTEKLVKMSWAGSVHGVPTRGGMSTGGGGAAVH